LRSEIVLAGSLGLLDGSVRVGHHVPMSFGLVVLAVDPGATDAEVRAMPGRCRSRHHPEGELDERIVGFYDDLRARYPDFPPHHHDSLWMMTPLDVGIDHVSMHLSFSERSTAPLQVIDELASHGGRPS